MTLAEIRTAVQALGYGSDTATAQTSIIASNYRQINAERRWKFLEKDGTATATVGTTAVNLAAITDIRDIDAIRLEISTEYEPDLGYLDPQEFRSYEHIDRDVGIPLYWTLYEDTELRLWPRPDRAYTVRVDYIKTVADLSADGNTPVWPATYHDILKWGCAMQLATRERDWDAYAVFDNEYEQLLGAMRRSLGIRQRQTPGHVARSKWWGDRVV